MTQLEQLLRERLKSASGELTTATKERDEKQRQVDLLTRKVEAFSRALKVEIGDDEIPVPPAIKVQQPTSSGDANKSQIVRDLVKSNAEVGTTVNDIRTAFDKAGVHYHPNYPYAVWRRLRDNGSVREVRGKLYPPQTATASE